MVVVETYSYVLKDMNNLSTNVYIFSKTRFSNYDDGNMYALNNYTLFRNDDRMTNNNERPYGGMAFYSLLDFYPGYPHSRNCNGIEITTIRFIHLSQEHIFGMYHFETNALKITC